MAENEVVTSEQKMEQPVVSQAQTRQQKRVVIVCCGQGGTNIGTVMFKDLRSLGIPSEIIAVNTSAQDLDQIPEDVITKNPNDWRYNCKFKIGDSISGAGKNRDDSKEQVRDYARTFEDKKLNLIDTFMYYYEEILFHENMQTFIINCFSPDGGTGSGVGPMLGAFLAARIKNTTTFTKGGKVYTIDEKHHTVPKPVVMNLVPKCAVNGGQKNLQNNIECFKDIQSVVDKGITSFFIADNNLPEGINYSNTNEMYSIINARIVMPFLKFLGIEMNSSIKCLDLQDIVNTLNIPGCSSFTTISAVNNFQYVVPRGQSCTRVVEMLKFSEDGSEEAAAKQLLANYDIISKDTMQVFFDPVKSGLNADSISKDFMNSSMIGFFGFKSLNAIVEDLRANLHRLQESTDNKASVIRSESTGFASIAEDKVAINDAFEVKSVSTDDVMSIF